MGLVSGRADARYSVVAIEDEDGAVCAIQCNIDLRGWASAVSSAEVILAEMVVLHLAPGLDIATRGRLQLQSLLCMICEGPWKDRWD